jgi:hypothetical protein
MTPEEFDRRVEFMLDSQAGFAARQERDHDLVVKGFQLLTQFVTGATEISNPNFGKLTGADPTGANQADNPVSNRRFTFNARALTFRMKRQTVSFAIEHNGAEPEGRNRMPGQQHTAAVHLDGFNGLIEAVVGIQVEQRSAF